MKMLSLRAFSEAVQGNLVRWIASLIARNDAVILIRRSTPPPIAHILITSKLRNSLVSDDANC
jgi:hypothetical protein